MNFTNTDRVKQEVHHHAHEVAKWQLRCQIYLEAQKQIIGDVSQQVDDPICDQIFPIAKTIKKEINK